MGKSVVVLIHGVGRHGPGWAQKPIEALITAASDYPEAFSVDNPVDKSVEFVPVLYDDIFEMVRTQWQTLSTQLLSSGFPTATPLSISSVSSGLKQLTDDTFWGTHALDALLYATLPLVRNIVRYSVAAQLAECVATRVKGVRNASMRPRFVIVAHSLGTAVAHDAIQLLGTRTWLNHPYDYRSQKSPQVAKTPTKVDISEARRLFGENPFAPGVFRWNGLMMISNVSTVFCKDVPPDSPASIVRPLESSYGPVDEAVEYYINVDHQFDPVGKVDPFSATRTWPISLFAQDRVHLKHFRDPNVHGLAHYLIHPEVHSRIFAMVCPNRFGWERVRLADSRVKADGDFARFSKTLANDDLRQPLEEGLTELLSSASAGGWDPQDVIDTFTGLGKVFKRLNVRAWA